MKPTRTATTLSILAASLLAGLLLMGPAAFAADPPAGQDDPHATEPSAHEAHGAGGHHGEHMELPHFLMVLRNFDIPVIGFGKDSAVGHFIHVFENAIFAVLAGTILSLLFWSVYRRRSEMPSRAQAFAEMVVESLDSLVVEVIGPHGRKYTPFIGTLFLYILIMNYMGLVPLMKAPTATLINNASLALLVFLFVQYTGIRSNGLGGYLHHMAGSPKDVVGWCVAPLLFVLELVGEIVKPVSLSLRLFGNIMGEDTLLAVFALLGVVSLSFIPLPGWAPGLPLHLPFLLLSMLLGLIQALVFSLLATVYISLALGHAHDEHHVGDEQPLAHG